MAEMTDRPQIPTNAELLNPTMAAIRSLGGSATIAEIEHRVTADLGLPEDVTLVPHDNRSRTELAYRLAWARTRLKIYGILDNSPGKVWFFTPEGENTEAVDPSEVARVVRERYLPRIDDDTPDPATQPADFPDVEGDSWRALLMEALRNMPPDAFERLCQRLLRESGFVEVEVTSRSPRDSRMISEGDRAKIVTITRKLLEDRFKGDFVFDPIAAVPKIDEYGDEYVEIYIVFDGDQKKLDPVWTHRMLGLIIDELEAVGVELPHSPSDSFVKKSDWNRLYRKRYGEYESLRPD